MKELRQMNMYIFKRNTCDVAVQCSAVVVVVDKMMVTILPITYCSRITVRLILTMMRMVCFYATSF